MRSGGSRWFDRRPPEKYWPGVVVAIGATAALFASAFVTMQRVRQWTGQTDQPVAAPVVIRLSPPPPPLERPRRLAETPRPTPAPTQAPSVTPTTVPPPVIAEPSVAAPAAPRAVARDTGTAGAKTGPAIPLGASRPSLGRTPLGAPNGSVVGVPSGVTIGSRTANTAAFRDSVLQQRLKGIPELARERKPTGAEKAALELSQRIARNVARRATTSGNSNVHVPMGEGVDGVGAAGGGLSKVHRGNAASNDLSIGSGVPLPFLSSGPSAAQRKKNEALDAEYQLRLRRLEDRILLKRDSVKRDSVRRDSVRRDSLHRDSVPRVRDQRSDVRGQTSEVRRQRSDV